MLIQASEASELDYETLYSRLLLIENEVSSLRISAELASSSSKNLEQLRSEEQKLYRSSMIELENQVALERSRNAVLWDVLGATALAGGIASFAISAFPDTRIPGITSGLLFLTGGLLALFGPWR